MLEDLEIVAIMGKGRNALKIVTGNIPLGSYRQRYEQNITEKLKKLSIHGIRMIQKNRNYVGERL